MTRGTSKKGPQQKKNTLAFTIGAFHVARLRKTGQLRDFRHTSRLTVFPIFCNQAGRLPTICFACLPTSGCILKRTFRPHLFSQLALFKLSALTFGTASVTRFCNCLALVKGVSFTSARNFIVNPRKLEHGCRRNSARIPYTLL